MALAYGNGGYGAPINSISGSSALAVDQQKLPQVSAQISRMQNLLEGLHNSIHDLEARVASVTVPEGPTASASDKQSMPAGGVVIAATLGEMNLRIEAAVARLNSLFNRIEI